MQLVVSFISAILFIAIIYTGIVTLLGCVLKLFGNTAIFWSEIHKLWAAFCLLNGLFLFGEYVTRPPVVSHREPIRIENGQAFYGSVNLNKELGLNFSPGETIIVHEARTTLGDNTSYERN